MNSASGTLRSNQIRSTAIFIAIATVGAWVFSRWILAGDVKSLIVVGAMICGGFAFLAILQDWRRGLYLFLVWLVFEDLIRKFAGNATAMFFVKDVIALMTYLSMFSLWRRGRLPVFRPHFAKWLLIFVALGIIQIFNPHSPHIFYGLLGFKLYFFYVPMMFAGYAYMRGETDLQKFLQLNMWITIVVSGLGIAQSVLGLSFLNPAQLAPELQNLGHLVRVSPLTHIAVSRPTSVFVSDGRFAQFLTMMFLLGFGAIGYTVLKKQAKPILLLCAVGITTVAALMTGSRSAFVSLIGNSIVLVAAFYWGIPERMRRSLRIGRAVRRIVFASAAAITLLILLFPEEFNARWSFYSETLSPTSSASEFSYRSWQYPLATFTSVFRQPNWFLGNGIGTTSLGVQYVAGVIEQQKPEIGAESGYGELILEFGVLGLVLWIAWTGSLLRENWRIVRTLRNTRGFPIGFALFWFAAYLLVFYVFYGLVAYQNYLPNAYLWLFVGIVFRLPHLVGAHQEKAASYASVRP